MHGGITEQPVNIWCVITASHDMFNMRKPERLTSWMKKHNILQNKGSSTALFKKSDNLVSAGNNHYVCNKVLKILSTLISRCNN
jgi:hypothetical protein